LRSSDIAQDRHLRLHHPDGTAIAVPCFVPFVFYVVKSLRPIGCDSNPC
jgi:hypothetical protein